MSCFHRRADVTISRVHAGSTFALSVGKVQVRKRSIHICQRNMAGYSMRKKLRTGMMVTTNYERIFTPERVVVYEVFGCVSIGSTVDMDTFLWT